MKDDNSHVGKLFDNGEGGGLNIFGPWDSALLGGVALLKEVWPSGDGE